MYLTTAGDQSHRPARIAVIGAGAAGLAAAWRLSKNHHVTLFEARPRLGGHVRTLLAGRESQHAVDTGFMVFNYRNYPELNKLFDELDVPVIPSDMSFAVSLDDGHFEYGVRKPRRLFAQPKNIARPAFWRMLTDIVKFSRLAESFKTRPHITLGECLDTLKMSDYFRSRYLCPLAGAIWSTSTTDMLDFPAATLINFFDNHGLLATSGAPKWFTVSGGSNVYVERLHKRLVAQDCQIATASPITQVRKADDHVTLHGVSDDYGRFDQVVFACHSDQALAMIERPTSDQESVLSKLRYKKNTVVLHDDATQMPQRRACWASWVYKGYSQGKPCSSFTYWMNLLQSIPNESPLFVTLNPTTEIPDEHIFDSTSLSHPQFDLAAIKAQQQIPTLQGIQRSWYCGAYTRHGFHEDAFASGLHTADLLTSKLESTSCG